MKKLLLPAVYAALFSPLGLLGIAAFTKWLWIETKCKNLVDAYFDPQAGLKWILFLYYDYCLVWPGCLIVTLSTLTGLALLATQIRNRNK